MNAPNPDAPDPVAALLARLPARISHVVIPWAEQSPDRPALLDASGTWTFAALAEAIRQGRDWLAARGVRPGDRVMVVGENCRAGVAAILAAADLDAWPVPLDARLADPEIDAIRAHCRPRLTIYVTGASPQARARAARDGAAAADVPGLGQLCVGARDDACDPEPAFADPARQVAALIYTSGSSGQPKAVMLTHRNLLFAAATAGAIRRLAPGDRLAGLMPLSHVVGLAPVLLGGLMHGAAVHLMARFHPAGLLHALAQDRLSVVLGTPALLALLLEYASRHGVARAVAPDLRILSVSGAPLDPAVKQAAERLFGLKLHHGYGLTETSPTIAQIRPEAPRDDISVGPPIPGVECRLVAMDGEVGELHVRGPNVMKGYYRAPEATAAVLDADGWFNTRDLVRFDGDCMFVVGRAKDLIIRFGFNVHPPEVEAVLNAHPAVRQSAVVGRPVEGNEEVIAFVQPVAGAALSVPELADYAAARLAPYRRPTAFVLVETMPATASGKIGRRDLQARVLGAAPA